MGILLSISFYGLFWEVISILHLTNKSRKASASIFALLFIMGLLVGSIGIYYINTSATSSLTRQVDELRDQLSKLTGSQTNVGGSQTINVTNQTITLYRNSSYLPDLYDNARVSVVLV